MEVLKQLLKFRISEVLMYASTVRCYVMNKRHHRWKENVDYYKEKIFVVENRFFP